jgi:hypothetical protein
MAEDSRCSLHIFSSRSQDFFLVVLPRAWCFPYYSSLTFQVTRHFHIFIRDFRSRLCVTQCISFSVSIIFFFTFHFTVLLLRNVAVLRSPEGPAFIPRPKRVLILGHFMLYFSLFRLLLAIYIYVCVYIYIYIYISNGKVILVVLLKFQKFTYFLYDQM